MMVCKPLPPDTRKLPPRRAGLGLGEGVSVDQGKVGGTNWTVSVLPGRSLVLVAPESGVYRSTETLASPELILTLCTHLELGAPPHFL